MPAAVISISGQLRAQFTVLSLAPPGMAEIPFGILLLDSQTRELQWKLRTDTDQLPISPEDAEYCSYLESDFRARMQEMTGSEFLESIEDSFSGFLRLSEREAVSARNLPGLLDRLFAQFVQTRVVPYETHLPLYRLRAAATKFGEDSEVSEADGDIEWVLAPAGLRLSPELFVVQVVGRSMEPLIPDGSLTVFRKIAPGSRQGKRLLIEELGATGTSARFTVKRYTSTKNQASEDEWAHGTIRLEPLNPEFPAFELDAEAFEGKYRVIGSSSRFWRPSNKERALESFGRPEMLAYMRSHKLAVIATVAADGSPQSALVGVGTTDALEVVFDTLSTTRKHANLQRDRRIAVTYSGPGEITLQYEGVAALASSAGNQDEVYREAYYRSWPYGRERTQWPNLVYWRVSPRWARYSDYDRGPLIVEFFWELD